ncbi:MAG: hypothetical protein Q9207_004315 [Kuettlingeria erythrocarpa]
MAGSGHIKNGISVLKLVNLQRQPSSDDCQVVMSRAVSNSNHLFFSLPVRRRPLCVCATLPPPSSYLCPVSSKSFSTSSSSQYNDLATTASEQPRWRATPSRMVNRGTSHRFLRNSKPFTVNEDPEKLDEVLTRVLGTYGDRLLTEEVKWLTVTHKSFDHGRRGFNDRLAYLGTLDLASQYWATSADTILPEGKRIVDLQASIHIIAASAATPEPTVADRWGREPFKHPVLEGLAGLTQERKKAVLEKNRLARLAGKYGLTGVLRWKPKSVSCPGEVTDKFMHAHITIDSLGILRALALMWYSRRPCMPSSVRYRCRRADRQPIEFAGSGYWFLWVSRYEIQVGNIWSQRSK